VAWRFFFPGVVCVFRWRSTVIITSIGNYTNPPDFFLFPLRGFFVPIGIFNGVPNWGASRIEEGKGQPIIDDDDL